MKIAIGSDHAGYDLKESIKAHVSSLGHDVEDVGTHSKESVDYPVYAEKVASLVAASEADRGILICGTGIGMSIAANKIRGAYAALCSNEFSARMSRLHNAANILVLGSRVTGDELARAITDAWLGAEDPADGRHQARRDMIREIESKNVGKHDI